MSALARRSKAHWGYPPEFLEACTEELTIDQARLADGNYPCFVAEHAGTVLGFYALDRISDSLVELDALFVEPANIRSGIGRALVRHAVAEARALGARRLVIQGDPNAAGFYTAMGARPCGERESASIPGRMLPLFEIDLAVEAPD
ncbi:MAG: GNAT family N-acetyltransferase [Woeseiaceae bacterium]|nr:GNAT family N-acetyltransferase [Woeseiaceae bacterium]